jgi:hypothetical protein
MAANAFQIVIDEHTVQANTENYEYALERALTYLLSGDISTKFDPSHDICRNLIAIRVHLLTPRAGLVYKTWLFSWTNSLYWIWASEVYERIQESLIEVVRIGAPQVHLDC